MTCKRGEMGQHSTHESWTRISRQNEYDHLMEIHEPRFFETKKARHLLMSMDYYMQNQPDINRLLEVHGFDDDREVTRIDSDEDNLVEFVQPITGENYDSLERYFEGSGEEAYH